MKGKEGFKLLDLREEGKEGLRGQISVLILLPTILLLLL